MAHGHDHVFLGAKHAESERNVWAVIALTVVMMVVEIAGGAMFGSIALIADGFHMSTHAGALLLAALAYTLARRHANDPAFTFGSGKFGDLAGFSSALILAVIAIGIGFESAARFIAPQPISFGEAIPIAALGLIVNVVSAWLLSRGGHDHHHGGAHHHHHHGAEWRRLEIGEAAYKLEIYEDGAPPRFRVTPLAALPLGREIAVETIRDGGARQTFPLSNRGRYFESRDEIPEPHEFAAILNVDGRSAECEFEEGQGGHGAMHADHNMRAALLHVLADAAVSVLVIFGLTLAKAFGWLWMDPLAGFVGACVIASWSYQLIRDTARVLLDMNPEPALSDRLRSAIERQGDELVDCHLWRLGPGHLGAILMVETSSRREADHYRELAQSISPFSHLTIEIARRPALDGGGLRDAA
jgi:cation diffusion facilitator family transporter